LICDLETAPNKAFVWSLFKVNVAIDQIVEPGYTLCWAAKWLDDKKIMFSSINDGKEVMLKRIYDLLEEADVVISYNGNSFDLPTLNKEFAQLDWAPPSSYQQIDLLQVVRKRFRFPSNKLDYVARALGLGSKTKHKGMALWSEVMQGNKSSWNKMEEYNKQDVILNEKLYKKIRSWINTHPNHGLFDLAGEQTCPNCGGHRLQRRGYHYTKTMKYQRWQCQDCKTWSRSRATDTPKEDRVGVLVGVA
jgi:hypothetical protein